MKELSYKFTVQKNVLAYCKKTPYTEIWNLERDGLEDFIDILST